MTTLHLSVLNDGSVYNRLRYIARDRHCGKLTDAAAFAEFRSVVSMVVSRERIDFGEPSLHSPDDITAAARDVMDYHAARISEEPPVYSWRVKRGDDGREVRFTREQDAFGYILRAQGQSVHYATTHGGWSYEPIGKAE